MNPRTPSPRAHASRRLARRVATFVAVVSAVSAAPLVAHADDDAGGQIARGRKPVFQPVDEPAAVPTPEPAAEPEPEPAPEPEPEPAPEPTVDPTVAALTAGYEWDERGSRVEVLQDLIGVTVDGWYGAETARAHRAALEFAQLPTDVVPAPVLPPGPSAAAWAALRDCEAGGDYTITNPSGKYRGAYQFDRSTWNSVAERHDPQLVGADPAAAAPADQDAMALALYHERGSRPWPNCGRHLR